MRSKVKLCIIGPWNLRGERLMELFSVGKKYPKWATGEYIAQMHYVNGVLLFLYGIPFPRQKEVDILKQDQIAVALSNLDGLLFFIIQLGRHGWQDAPFEPCLYEDNFDIEYPQGEGAPFTILMVDTGTGELKGIQNIGLSNSLSTAFMEQCRQRKAIMAGKSFDMEKYQKQVTKLYEQYPASEDMLDGSRPEWVTVVGTLD